MTPIFFLGARRELAELPDTLRTLAALADIRSAEIEAGALRDAAEALEPLDLRQRAAFVHSSQRGTRGDVSPHVAETFTHILEEGGAARIADACARLPRDLARLIDAADLPLHHVLDLVRRSGAVTAGDLALAVERPRLEPGVRQRTANALPALRTDQPRVTLGRAVAIFEQLQAALAGWLPAGTPLLPLGSLRRFAPTVGDVEALAVSEAPAVLLDRLSAHDTGLRMFHRGGDTCTFIVREEQVTLRSVTTERAPVVQLLYTGSAAHLRTLRRRAKTRGLEITPDGLRHLGSGETIAVADESDIYLALDVWPMPPELREGDVDLTETTDPPSERLLQVEDMRGDLHMHTFWSDGRSSVDAMVAAARTLGYEYIAITDHSERAHASRTLSVDRLWRQAEDIEAARERYPDIRILHGAEVDILPDGTLDFEDDVLTVLDIVLASLHDDDGQAPDQLLERYVSAMRHPLVGVITHPANRMVGRRDGYDLDFDELFRVAAATGTALEVDGGPSHLDLDGALARRAAAAGVTLVVDSDCHNASLLGRQMRLGVGTARRGGVAPRHVLNTRPWDEAAAFLHQKISGSR